jgi:hypothetical protein
MLWGTSSLALYIPWAGKAGPYLGVSLWLWLGVLDAIQGVGLGMILLQVIIFLPHIHDNSFDTIMSDALPTPRLCDFGILSNPRFNLCHGCPCYGPQSDRSRERLPRCGSMGLQRRSLRKPHGLCRLLDCTLLPAHHCYWLFLVLPQGTAWYADTFA